MLEHESKAGLFPGSRAEQQHVCHPSGGCQEKLEDEHRLVRSPLFVGLPEALACVKSLGFTAEEEWKLKVGAL